MKQNPKEQIDIANYTLLFKDISELILTKGNLSNTASTILNLISGKVESLFYILLLVDENNNLVLQSFTTEYYKKLTKLIPFDIYRIKYPLSEKKALITQCVTKNKIIQSKRLRDFFSPIFKPAILLDTIQNTIGVNLCVGIPIKHGNKVIGSIAFGTKKHRLNEEEINMLELYANLSGIAINNNLQFQRIQKQYETEKTTTSILSHELKTPIAIAHNSAQSLTMVLENIKSEIGENTYNDIMNKSHDIKISIQRMLRICNSIFSLREVEANIPEDIHEMHLEHQLGPILNTFEQKAKVKGLDFHINIQKLNKKYFAGIVQLEQIVTILLDNAVKYTEKGEIHLNVRMRNNTLYVTARDTGCGIPEKEHGKIFNRFYRHNKTKKSIEGLGLGLYVAKKIVGKLQGSIQVRKNPLQRGTEFIIKIPVYNSRKELKFQTA